MGTNLLSTVIIVLILLRAEKVDGSAQRFYTGSSKDLRNLAQMDFEILAGLRYFKETLAAGHESSPSLLAAIQAYLKSSVNTTRSNPKTGLNATEHVEEILNNPLSIFTVMHRCAQLLRSLNKAQTDIRLIPASLIKLRNQFKDDSWPLQKDLDDAAECILQIQFLSNLTAADLSAGNVHGISTRTRLQASHCFYIGLTAKFWKKYTLAVEWFLEAKRLARVDGTVAITTVNAELVELIKEHDKILWSQGFTDPYFFMTPLKSLESLAQKTVPTVKEILQEKFGGKGRNCSFWPMNIWSLCSGEKLNMPKASVHLFCWHEFKVNKVFTIGPLRMEFLSRNPDIVQVHNAFSNTELAEASGSNAFPHVNSQTEHVIQRKVEQMTGLVTEGASAADRTLIVSHLPGGRTELSVDSQEDFDSRGDWISTVMIYLSNVTKGGSTVFPAGLATAVPSRGSAIFWFNTFSDGSPDLSTAHEECPVVWGQKMVAYKRMRFYDQFKVHKCSLRPKERFQVLVNGKALPVPRVFAHKIIEQEEIDDPTSLSVEDEAESIYNKVEHQVRKYAYSPGSNLEALVRLDWEIYQNIRGIFSPRMDYGGSGQAQSLVLSYLQDFHETAYHARRLNTNGTDAETVARLSRNPLAVYRTFWRFENYIKKFLRLPAKDLAQLPQVCEYISKVYNKSDGPLKRDLEDAMSGILIMQFAHDLKSKNIARGIVAGMDTGITLSAKQCIEIGSHAISTDYYYQAIDWMETALAKVTYENDTTANLAYAKEQLDTSKKVHDKLLVKSPEIEPTFYTNPVSRLNSLTDIKTRKEILYDTYKLRTEPKFGDINLIGLCQGRRHQTVQEQSKLFCWLEHKVDPYFQVGPLQVELYAMRPKAEVVVYHNILNQKQLAFLRNDTGRSFFRSAVKAGGETHHKSCLSAKFLLHGSKSEQALRILKSASAITGLSATQRTITVQSYTPGGHYSSHVDTGGSDLGETETEAMATFMYYVTKPEKGGGTAFPAAGAHVSPSAGSAVFWFDVLSSVEMDTLSTHGGCPVIFGEKRVATIFIPFGDQSQGKCDTDPTRRLEVLVNGKSKYR